MQQKIDRSFQSSARVKGVKRLHARGLGKEGRVVR